MSDKILLAALRDLLEATEPYGEHDCKWCGAARCESVAEMRGAYRFAHKMACPWAYAFDVLHVVDHGTRAFG